MCCQSEHKQYLIFSAAVCMVVLRTKEHLSGPASYQEAPCLVRQAPTGRQEGDGGSGVRHHRIQRTDSLPFPRCQPWFVVMAYHTGEALAIPIPCDLVPRCQLLAFHLRDAHSFFFFQEGGGKFSMKINELQSREGTQILETSAHDSIFRATRVHWRQEELNLVLKLKP